MESYNYAEQKKRLCTEENIGMILKIRDRARRLLNESGAFSLEMLFHNMTGESWLKLAAVELLAERKELYLVYDNGNIQDRIYK